VVQQAERASVLRRFLARGAEPNVEYRALRHLEAHNAKFGADAWMDVWTEFDKANGLRYEIVAEGGNRFIRKKVLRAALDGEQKLWAAHEPDRASIDEANYVFEEGAAADGLATIRITPRRKDVLLIDGAIFVQLADGDLKRIAGRLSRTPSFWTRKVEITRSYERIGGVRVPVSIESVASVLVAGKSSFKMTYRYQIINGQRVGDPEVTEAVITGSIVSGSDGS
jgi:hypothetical protein